MLCGLRLISTSILEGYLIECSLDLEPGVLEELLQGGILRL